MMQGFYLAQSPSDLDANQAREAIVAKLDLTPEATQGLALSELTELLLARLTNLETRLAWMSPGDSPHD